MATEFLWNGISRKRLDTPRDIARDVAREKHVINKHLNFMTYFDKLHSYSILPSTYEL